MPSPPRVVEDEPLHDRLKQLQTMRAVSLRRTREAWQKTRKRLERVAESAGHAFILLDRRRRMVQVVAVERRLGYSPEELVGRPVTALFPDGLPAAADVPKRREVVHTHTRRRHGDPIPVQIRLRSLKNGGVLLWMLDDGPERRARDARRVSEEWLRLAQFSMNIALWDWDLTTNRLTWTPTRETIFEADPGTMRRYEDFAVRVHRDDLAQFEAERDKAIQKREPFASEFRIVRPSGEIRWVAAHGRSY